MKSLQQIIRNLPFDAYEMEYDSQLRRLLLNSKAVRGIDLVVEELWLPGGRSRADVAVVNEELSGFELKAGRDRLDRLPRQIQAYDSLFRYSNVVTVPAHLPQVEKMVPSHWGIWVALGEGRSLRLRCLRRPTANLRRDKVRVAQLLNREECIRKLQELGMGKGASKLSKEALAQKLGRVLFPQEMDNYLCKCLHERAAARAEAFTADGVWNAVDREIEQDKAAAALSLSHLVHAGVLGTAAADRPLPPVADRHPSPSLPLASPQLELNRRRLEELRAEFAEAARKHIEKASAPAPNPMRLGPPRLGFGPR